MAELPKGMRLARLVCWLVVVVMSANLIRVIVYSGMDHGAGGDTFTAGYADPWQGLINSDLVCGLLLMMSWVGCRERASNRWATALWLWIIFYWGNIVVAIYTLRAMSRAKGEWSILLLGENEQAVAAPLPLWTKAALYAIAAGLFVYIAWSVSTVKHLTGIVWWGYLGGFAPFIPAAVLIANRERL